MSERLAACKESIQNLRSRLRITCFTVLTGAVGVGVGERVCLQRSLELSELSGIELAIGYGEYGECDYSDVKNTVFP